MNSGYEVRSRPIFAAGFRPARERAGLLSGVVYGIRTRVAGVKARHPWPARRTRHERSTSGCVRARVAGEPARCSRCTWARPRAHPRFAVPSARAWRVVQGHTRKWSGRRGSNPWPRPWRGRALPIELHPLVCKARGRPVPALPCGKLLMNGRCGCSVAARWPQKTKRPGSIRNPGLSCEKWAGRIYTSCCPGCLCGSRWP